MLRFGSRSDISLTKSTAQFESGDRTFVNNQDEYSTKYSIVKTSEISMMKYVSRNVWIERHLWGAGAE